MTAGRPGETVLTIEADGAMLGVRVVVKKYAGEPVEPATVECTGHPAPAELEVDIVREQVGQSGETIGRSHSCKMYSIVDPSEALKTVLTQRPLSSTKPSPQMPRAVQRMRHSPKGDGAKP